MHNAHIVHQQRPSIIN